jgi:hypothetical protein
MGFVLQDKFNASGKLDIYNFVGQQNYSGAWHVIPLQLTAALRWQPSKDYGQGRPMHGRVRYLKPRLIQTGFPLHLT